VAKFPTFPTLYDEVLQLNISKLRDWGYLTDSKKGAIKWSYNGEDNNSMSIETNANIAHPYIELNYKFNSEPIKYKVKLVTVSSNLGKGLIWYFLCPYTNKRCRKLYLLNGYFLHREAIPGCMYESQTKSKRWRLIIKHWDKSFKIEEAYEQLYGKHFKSHYAGKPTKRYIQLMKRIEG
jgi:hypothetical protein